MKRLIVVALFLTAVSATATVVLPIGAASQVLIPAAGSAPGADGAFFRSDITIVNLTSRDQSVSLQWLPQGVTGVGLAPVVITIPAQTGIRSADFVHNYLGQTGLGAIVIKGLTSTGQADSTATLYVASRIWTPQPGTTGTTSQSFPAIPMNAINTPAAALFSAGGQDNPANYRVNVGVVNVDPNNAQQFQIGVAGSGTFYIVNVPPMSMQQISLGSGLSASAQILIFNITTSATRSNLWTAYDSTLDNTTGDAWSELAVAGTAP